MRTVRVVILVSMGGDGFHWEPGLEVELPRAEANRLIKAGYAEPAPKPVAPKAID